MDKQRLTIIRLKAQNKRLKQQYAELSTSIPEPEIQSINMYSELGEGLMEELSKSLNKVEELQKELDEKKQYINQYHSDYADLETRFDAYINASVAKNNKKNKVMRDIFNMVKPFDYGVLDLIAPKEKVGESDTA